MKARTSTIDAATAARWFGKWSDPESGFTVDLLGEGAFKCEADAVRAWPLVRARVWAACRRFTMPSAARRYDGLSTDGLQVLLETWNDDAYSVSAVLVALRRDWAHLGSFERDDAAGAASIASFLDLLRQDFN